MKYIGYILLLIIFILVCILAVLNTALIPFNYIFGIVTLPIIVLALLCFIIGLIIGALLMLFSRKKRKKIKAHQ